MDVKLVPVLGQVALNTLSAQSSLNISFWEWDITYSNSALSELQLL